MLSEPKMPRSMQFHYSHHVTTFNSLHNLNHCFCGSPKCSANNIVKYLHLQFSYFRKITQCKEVIIGDTHVRHCCPKMYFLALQKPVERTPTQIE